ncbi:MAG: HAMP domain-containing sensor histidine kinase [Sulfuricurvum sp.]|nr:HAMP domain-containing sensor histidine kinase [Sulfuricurvum sp.]MDD5386840.1 HAMP domain-containing sensor histidine kinase [Sulfuricurvum sp.]
MLKIHQLFFLNTLALFVGTLTIASFIGYYTLKEMIINDNINHLQKTLELVSVRSNQSNSLDHYVNAVHNQTDYRATVFDNNGKVLAESNIDKRSVDSMRNRKEVMNAVIEPYGVEVRYSATFDEDYIFVAKQIAFQGNIVILRLGVTLHSVMGYFYQLWIKLASSFALFIIIALIIAFKISKKAQYDIAQITHYLHEISAKNYAAVLKPEHFREFLQITLLLKNLVKKLRNRDKQKRKYTARLRLINKQQNDILSAISHEFKNPVAAIVGYTETLEEDPNLSLAIREKFLGKIHSNALKISTMLDRLALSVKLENNDLSIKPTTFDLDTLCRDVTSTLQGKYPKRVIIYEGCPKEVVADRTMIDLVITNLIDNAIKYSEDVVTLRLSDHAIEVTDKGIGIAPHELELIASKFYRVQKNSWDNSMGLGLAIVSYILKLHDSTLRIESTLGVGSTFSFELDTLVPKK